MVPGSPWCHTCAGVAASSPPCGPDAASSTLPKSPLVQSDCSSVPAHLALRDCSIFPEWRPERWGGSRPPQPHAWSPVVALHCTPASVLPPGTKQGQKSTGGPLASFPDEWLQVLAGVVGRLAGWDRWHGCGPPAHPLQIPEGDIEKGSISQQMGPPTGWYRR